MHNNALLHEVLRGNWLISEQYAYNALPMLAKWLREGSLSVSEMAENKAAPKLDAKALPLAMGSVAGKMTSYSSYDDAPAGSTAIVSLRGTVMKNDFCGAPGTRTLDGWVKEADAHPNISSILLVIDSPGGSVAGTFSFAGTIAAAQKPVLAFVEDLAASAGYAIASGAKEIWAASRTTQIGSIGTMIALTDSRALDEQFWGKEIVINATGSPDKNKAYFEALEGNPKPIIKEVLDPLNEVFHDTVKANRSGKLKADKNNEPLTGKTYVAETAMNEFGLIDAIGTMEEAITHVQSLASTAQQDNQPTTKQTTTDTNTTMKRTLKTTWAAMIGVLGFTVATGATETTEEMSDEHLEKLNAELARLQGVETAHTALTAEHTTAKEALTASQGLVTDLTATVAKLGAMPGAKPTSAAKATTEDNGGGEEEDANDFFDPNADHNKAAEQMMKGKV